MRGISLFLRSSVPGSKNRFQFRFMSMSAAVHNTSGTPDATTTVTLSKSDPDTNTDWRKGATRDPKTGSFKVFWLYPDGIWKMPGLSNIMKWQYNRKLPEPCKPGDFPILMPDWGLIARERAALSSGSSSGGGRSWDVEGKEVSMAGGSNASSFHSNSCTWLGHATCLASIDNVNVLTDPVFSERCSPIQFAGPQRYTPAACTIAELPPIHIVLISHNHYDHLDYKSIMDLEDKFKPTYVVGLGLRQWFLDCNIDSSRIVEMDWWESREIIHKCSEGKFEAAVGPVTVQFVPVQHWSKRSLGDDLTTLWGGFVVAKDDFKFFFNGDTGYNEELFEEIGKRCGPVDISAIPIGAYEPRYIMKPQHVDPDEAFLIHKHLKSRYSFGIHFGTFILTDEPLLEPVERITKITKENPDVPPFEAIQHGATILMNKSDKTFRYIR